MACKTESRVIDSATFSVTQLPPLQALHLQMRVAKLLGPAIPFIQKAVEEKRPPLEAIQAVLDSLTPDSAVSLISDLVKMTARDGKMITNIDVSFVDLAPTTIYKVAAFVLEVNFSDFFDAFGKLSEASKAGKV